MPGPVGTVGTVGSGLGQLMAAEMSEQPEALGALLGRRDQIAAQVLEIVPRPLAGTVLVARGSSDHAAKCGAYFLEMASGRPVASTSPSIATLYRAPTDYRDYLLVAVSQSGRTPEIVEVVEQARHRGARAIALTNDAASPLAAAADLVIELGAGEEKAVPATKTVTAQIVAFALIAQALGDLGLSGEAGAELPGQVAAVLADAAPAEEMAAWLADHDRLITVARGVLYGAASEAALKVEETTARITAAFSAADLRHGPIAMASNGPPVLAFAHPGPAAGDVLELVAELRARGGRVRLLGPVPGGELGWAEAAPEILAPVLATVRGQQLALYLSRLLGFDADSPPGLTKVTVT